MSPVVFTPFHHKNTKRLRHFFIGAGITLWIGATITALLPILPHILYRLSPKTTTKLTQNLIQTNLEKNSFQPRDTLPPPDFDSNLPNQNVLIIDPIGVQGIIHQDKDPESALKKGVWITPNWGTPEHNTKPIILASHRWGYLDWDNTYRRQNSFYNLPKLKPEAQITIIWNQRQYTYQTISTDTGETPSSLDFDLILYTCQLWNSPTRIFIYANRIL